MIITTSAVDPKGLAPGTVIRHLPSGSTAVLKERKADDSGWWMQDGGGLWDRAWNDFGHTDWAVLGPECLCCHGRGWRKAAE